jgi:hypothetical protein
MTSKTILRSPQLTAKISPGNLVLIIHQARNPKYFDYLKSCGNSERHNIESTCFPNHRSQDSSVGIATGYGLMTEESEFEPR